MKAKTCTVRSYERILPYAAEYARTHDELRREFALEAAMRRLERDLAAEIALDMMEGE